MTAKKKPKKAPAKKSTRAKAAPAAVEEPIALPAPGALEPFDESGLEDAFKAPEIAFARRTPLPSPPPPRPLHRRAIFIDVENTSRPQRITQAFEMLAIDRLVSNVDLVASGNWRVIGNETARLLAAKGAQLMHSAPATGVRDWSDLRIAVAAGVWLAAARPGDRLDIVSDDRAFDAVGDVAATLGVDYHRHSFRKAEASARSSAASAPAAASSSASASGRRRRGGRGRGRGSSSAGQSAAAPRASGHTAHARSSPGIPASSNGEALTPTPRDLELESTPVAPPEGGAPQSAPTEDLLQVVRELLQSSAQGMVTLNSVANRLKALGFERPPGSPRLVTRLRSVKELQVSPRGDVRLAGAEVPEATPVEGAAAPTEKRRRPRRRGGRGRKREGAAPPNTTTS
ncbi:MAG: hypothetical protein ACT4TC_10095 [Myxococcaceae bacterium]